MSAALGRDLVVAVEQLVTAYAAAGRPGGLDPKMIRGAARSCLSHFGGLLPHFAHPYAVEVAQEAQTFMDNGIDADRVLVLAETIARLTSEVA